ncbi:Exosome complex RNA-binding protein 1/RRP40/RRP4 [Kalmanozyma brasiliensis GHG001]|uniref:Ribosomal RNA-processing protein 40 n=1 Tax=Kalmanozyma brasiliensis (strain GHG001) TaxID=1365824 RepID=V5EV37_KALBG|nr:Exosome complex RNA-binding protein 1/RRP40/RRP4 [Kalmanozyma brasiliensis GHG001]EST07053.1 Exosome complex RNA-binding protein 1/RRP40/RRP4 [Kalmanozyma brasiliensis GHG001]
MIVLPGDVLPIPSSSSVKLGPGLLPTPHTSTLTAIRPGSIGILPSTKTTSTAAWVETNTHRYVPSPSDPVIGQITARSAEGYTVTLFSAHTATLPALSFEGATKRHRPNLKIGSLVYARVVSADRFTEPELTCVNPVTGKSDGFGDLKTTDERGERNGVAMLFRVSVGLCRSLLRPGNGVLKSVAAHCAFEAAVGANGAVWVRAGETRHVLAVGKVLSEADAGKTVCDADEVVDDGEEVDAEYVVKNRGRELDPKRIKAIVGEFL